ncbi:MAG: 6-phosphogluconate dehydrogenase, partial [Promethearchaeota archaeon CR_4]
MADKVVGFIGIGAMGKPMCGHLLKAGYSIFVHNRTKDKAADLLTFGAKWCTSPCEVARKSDIIFSMVGFPEDVEEVYLGKDGVLAGARVGTIVVDMTTSEPSLA